MSAAPESVLDAPGPLSAFLLSLVIAVPGVAVVALAFLLNWGR